MEQHTDVVVLETILKSIVSNPDAVTIDRQIDERGVLLTVNVDPADMGHLIGRQGRTIQSIRTLIKIVGAKNQARINIKIPGSQDDSRYQNREEGGYQNNDRPQETDRVSDALDDLKI
jgi:uncharacterized protein